MKKSNLKNPTLLFAGLALLSTTSCNRGMGCPTFSSSADLLEICAQVLSVIITIF